MYVVRLDDDIASMDAQADAADDLDLTDLLDHTSIDLAALAGAVADSQARRGGAVSLGEVIADHPLDQGLAELVGYLQVADNGTVEGAGTEQITWADAAGTARVATVPLIVFAESYVSLGRREEA